MYKTLELTLDTERTNNTKTNAQNFLVNTNDYESVKIIADIVQDKERVDLSDATVKLAIRKPDQTIVFQDGTVTAAIEGECEFVLGTQSYVLKGTHVAEVMIYFLDGKVVVTRAFAYHVAEGILSDTAIESTSWYQDVNELQLAVQELQVEVDAFIATAVEETRAEITEVDQRLTSQLAETTTKLNLKDFVRFGKVKLPSDFPIKVPFQLFRNKFGIIEHTYDVELLKAGANNVYVNFATGLDSRDGLTVENAVKTIPGAIARANALPDATVNIVFVEQVINYNVMGADAENIVTLTKNLNFLSNLPGGSYIHTGNTPSGYVWSLASGVYSTTRSAAKEVFDYKFKDARGNPVVYSKVGTLAECQVTRGTWYTNGSLVYINRIDGSDPTGSDVAIIIPVDKSIRFALNGFRLFIENVHFWISYNTASYDAARIEGTTASLLVCKNTSFAFAPANGVRIKVGHAYMIECEAFSNGTDGFNYHATFPMVTNPVEFAWEYDCYGYDNGRVANGTSNSTTAHEGMTTLRVMSVGHDTRGPVCADVNGCYSVLLDCNMYDSTRSAGNTKAGYYFDEVSAVKQGKAYLINCGGGGVNTFTVNSDGNVDIYVKNLEGNNIPTGLVLNTIA